MNELEELMQVAHIDFPRKLFMQEVRELFDSLSRNTKYDAELYKDEIERFTQNEPIYTDVRKISGLIRHKDSIFRASSFSMPRGFQEVPSGREDSVFDGIHFQTIPGYALGDHREEEIQIWREVKSCVEKYFEDH